MVSKKRKIIRDVVKRHREARKFYRELSEYFLGLSKEYQEIYLKNFNAFLEEHRNEELEDEEEESEPEPKPSPKSSSRSKYRLGKKKPSFRYSIDSLASMRTRKLHPDHSNPFPTVTKLKHKSRSQDDNNANSKASIPVRPRSYSEKVGKINFGN